MFDENGDLVLPNFPNGLGLTGLHMDNSRLNTPGNSGPMSPKGNLRLGN